MTTDSTPEKVRFSAQLGLAPEREEQRGTILRTDAIKLVAEIDRLRAALGRIEQSQALGTAHAVAGLALRGIVDDRPATSDGRAGCGFPYCGGDSPECATCGNKD